MGKSKKPFIDKKKASTYHIVYRSQRDVAGEDGDGGVVLWPNPNNNREIDQQVFRGSEKSVQTESKATAGHNDTNNVNNSSTLDSWKQQLSQAGLVDDFDYDKHMKPITGTGVFFSNKETNVKEANALANARSQLINPIDDLVQEVDRKLESITLTADCMDDDIAQALFGDFDENDFEELNDEFVLDAAMEPPKDHPSEETPAFDFATHIQSLMDKARKERDMTNGAGALDIIHEQGQQDKDFFARAVPLGEQDNDDDDDEFAHVGDYGDDMEGAWNIEGTPGVVPKLGAEEEKALCEKFEATLLEYDSDELGEGVDDDDVLGPLPLEGDKEIEAAIDDFLLSKNDQVFMAGTSNNNEHKAKGGSGFSALVGTKMVPLKELGETANVHGEIRPIEDVLGDADEILGTGHHAPPAEEIFIDGKSYYSEKIRNPWDCESILSTYSNLDNNPVTIGVGGRRRKKNKKGSGSKSSQATDDKATQQILLSDKTGLPLGVLPTKGSDDHDEEDGFDTYMSVNKGEARNKEESKEDKRLRKLSVKKEREVARMQKKMMREAFNNEFMKRHQEVMVDDVGGKTVFRF